MLAGKGDCAPFPTPLFRISALPPLRSGTPFPLDEAEHFAHNRKASVASLRSAFDIIPESCSALSRNGVQFPRNSQCFRSPYPNARPRWVKERKITVATRELYLAVAPSLLRDLATILIDCGFRPEEAYGLKWSYIRNGNTQNYEGKTARARRSVLATARSMNILEWQFPTASGEWIFPAETKSTHAEQSSIKKQHVAALRLSKVEPFVIYSLRHTCLTRWAESGMNPYELMRRAGHADLETTMRYVHMAGPRTDEVQTPHNFPHRADFTILRGGKRIG